MSGYFRIDRQRQGFLIKWSFKTRSNHIQTSGFTWEFRSSASHQRPGNGQVAVNIISNPVWMSYISISIYMLKLKSVSGIIQPISAVIRVEKVFGQP